MHTTYAQSVWKKFQEHMESSSKGVAMRRRLTQYVTNTILDNNYKGTTEQFALHFNEQLTQLEDISDPSQHFPPQIKLQLLQNAVRPINDLRIVETLDEFQSMRIANQKVLKGVLIAMQNKNKADCNENYRICTEEPVAPLYKG